MACGCAETGCNCVINAGAGITVTGSGSSANPYIISATGSGESTFAATSSNGAIAITPAGTNGHTPNFEFVLDPLTDPGCASISANGLFIDCSASSTGLNFPVVIVSGDGPIGSSGLVILADTDGGPITLTLPAVPSAGQVVGVKNYGSSGNLLTIDPNGNDVDNVAGPYSLLDLESDTLVWDNVSSWARL